MSQDVNDLEYSDYRKSIETIGQEIAEYHELGDDIHQSIHESVDSSRWVFIYPQAIRTLQLSDSEPHNELWKNAEHWRDAIQTMAYQCLELDVIDWLKRNTEIEI